MSELQHEIRDSTAFVTLNRPEQRNAITFEMYNGLAGIFRSIKIGGDVKCLIISGAGGKAFAAGTDISQFRDFSKPQDAIDYEKRIRTILNDIEQCPVPTIAAVTGACTGGGAAIAAACDIRICDNNLKFGFPIARTLGNCLSIDNLNRLAAIVGPSRLSEILLTARLIEAEEAASIGLVTAVLDKPDAVHARALEMASAMKNHAPLTMSASKEGLRRLRIDGPKADDKDLITGCYMSEDFKEGMEAFLSKRKPVWKGK